MLMKLAQIIRLMEVTNWNPIRPVLNALPFETEPNEPFRAKAGENDVRYRAG